MRDKIVIVNPQDHKNYASYRTIKTFARYFKITKMEDFGNESKLMDVKK